MWIPAEFASKFVHENHICREPTSEYLTSDPHREPKESGRPSWEFLTKNFIEVVHVASGRDFNQGLGSRVRKRNSAEFLALEEGLVCTGSF
jgi:hypothetical protein